MALCASKPQCMPQTIIPDGERRTLELVRAHPREEWELFGRCSNDPWRELRAGTGVGSSVDEQGSLREPSQSKTRDKVKCQL